MLMAPPASSVLTPTRSATPTNPTPPARWARWWTSPIARVDYGTDSRAQAWKEAWIPANRGITGALHPAVTFGGSSRAAAIEAAHALAAVPVKVRMDMLHGRSKLVTIHPAIAVLRDARAGAYWLAPLHTTVRSNGEWRDAPHTIDGGAFQGGSPAFRTPVVRSATSEMVAVVGRDRVMTPKEWRTAPHDSRV
ncbi:MAG: hypothetical protein JWO69_1833 [Thermoleophilia bacterium]|nr:hypothetical protein [Thermoleophilia bacterium]